MSKFKINLYCNDSLDPSTSDKNSPKHMEWVRDGSGEVNFYVSHRALHQVNQLTYGYLNQSKSLQENINLQKRMQTSLPVGLMGSLVVIRLL